MSDNEENTKRGRKARCAVVLLVILLLLVLLGVCLGVVLSAPHVNRGDDGEVARAFMDALRKNDAELARSLAVPEQRDRIDKWIARHTMVYECPPAWPWEKGFWDESEGDSGMGSAGDTVKWSWDYHCNRDGQYSFSVSGMTLERRGGEWVITDWEEICESRNRQENCE